MTNPIASTLMGFDNRLYSWQPGPQDHMPSIATFQPLYDRVVIGRLGDPVSSFDSLVLSIVRPLKSGASSALHYLY